METGIDTNLLQAIMDGVISLLELGGPVVVILLIASIFGFALALRKFLQYSKVSNSVLNRLDEAVDFWQLGKQKQAIEILNSSPLPIASDLRFGLEQGASMDSDSLHDEMLRRAGIFLRAYSKDLRLLELTYNLAPVLGLLGTVLGMIEAFRGLAASAGSASESSALAGGIWEALLTTAVGLSIAIVFAVLHALLSTRLETLADRITDIVSRVLTTQENN
jgi:biopolymer transport protein ExbB